MPAPSGRIQVVEASATLTGLPSILGTDLAVPVYSVLTPTTVADVITAGGQVSYVLVDGEAVLEADALTAGRTAVSLTADNVTDGTAGAEIQLSYSAASASRAPKVYWFATEDVSDPSVLAIAETAAGSEFKVRATGGYRTPPDSALKMRVAACAVPASSTCPHYWRAEPSLCFAPSPQRSTHQYSQC